MDQPRMKKRVSSFTKDMLQDAALRLGLPPLKKSAKKAAWVDHIVESLPERRDNLLLQLQLPEIDALRSWARTGEIPEDEFLLLCGLVVLERYGLAEPEKRYIDPDVLPWLELDEAERAQQRLQDNLADFMEGWLLHVGMMPMNELLRRAAALMDFPEADPEEVQGLCMAVLIARNGSRALYEDADGGLWALHAMLDDPEALLSRLQERYVAALSYPEFDEDALAFSARESLVPGDIKLYLPLLDWLEAHDVEEPDALLTDAVLEAQNERVSEATQLLLEEAQVDSLEDANAGIRLMNNLFNRIPRWWNKGHSPEALFTSQAKPSGMPRMPGRNDPCTCGSGRKYKQCCGRRMN